MHTTDEPEENIEVEEATNQKNNQTLAQLPDCVCWNCRQEGHVYMDCMASVRHIFCYKCGRPGVITPKCPTCQSGNQSRNVRRPGDARSKSNPASVPQRN